MILVHYNLNTCPLSGAKIFMDIEFEREMGERDAKMAKTDVSSVFIQDLTFKLAYSII